jgi:anti-sigma regulatory factor (Ser/Thr protein kinase)
VKAHNTVTINGSGSGAPRAAAPYAEFRLGLVAENRNLSLIRQTVKAALHAWDLPDLIDDAQVIINELATNGVTAAPGEWMEIRAELQPDGLMLACWDCTPEITLSADLAEPDAEGGRGLFVVACCATKYGLTPSTDRQGKTIWALLNTPAAAGTVA